MYSIYKEKKLSPCPAQNTNQLIEKLIKTVTSGEVLSPFERVYYAREAEHQEHLEQKYLILAFAYTADKNRVEAKKNALLSLDYMAQTATLVNAISVLQLNGYNADVLKITKDFIEHARNPRTLAALAPSLTALPNISYIYVVYESLSKAGLQAKEMLPMCEQVLSAAKYARDTFDIPLDAIGRISEFAARSADRFNATINNAQYTISPTDEGMSLVFNVEDGDFDLVDLDLELIDLLIDSGLDELALVARFELLPTDCEKVVTQYVN